MISTILTGGFDVQKLGGNALHDLRGILQTAFENGSGLSGFGKIHPSKEERLLLTQIRF